MQFHDELKQLIEKYRNDTIPENSIPCNYIERAYNSFNVVMKEIIAEVNGIWSEAKIHSHNGTQTYHHHANPPPPDLQPPG